MRARPSKTTTVDRSLREASVPVRSTSHARAAIHPILQLQQTIGNQAVQNRLLQRRPTDQTESEAVPPIINEVLDSPGQPLESTTRASMESRFGHDFSRVKVHTDTKAGESAQSIGARAYTRGEDIVFAEGKYKPEDTSGKQLLAHELAHVVQQTSGGNSDMPLSNSTPNHGVESEANSAADAVMVGRPFHPTMRTGLAVHRQAPPPPLPTLAGLTATRDAFNNAGAPDANNCAPPPLATLGVDGPALGQNGMEMIFRINGAIPPGTEFEITRTKATGFWQQDAGVWSRLGGWPAGTSDDHHDQDECQTPVGGRIFVVDTPGLPGSLDPTGFAIPAAGPVAATATAAVWKLSFAEWVIARNRGLGIGWQRISTPTFHRWHSILSVARLPALFGGFWIRVDTPRGEHNEIELGSTGTTGATP